MIKPEQVPAQVIEAFRVALKNDDTTFAEDFCIALNAWPGMHFTEFDDGQNAVQLRREITLPLPQENPDDKA